jgi:hypothetical protein
VNLQMLMQWLQRIDTAAARVLTVCGHGDDLSSLSICAHCPQAGLRCAECAASHLDECVIEGYEYACDVCGTDEWQALSFVSFTRTWPELRLTHVAILRACIVLHDATVTVYGLRACDRCRDEANRLYFERR